MRKRKFEKWCEDFGFEQLRQLAESGLDDRELARKLSLDINVFKRWRSEHKNFDSAIRLGRAEADYAVVEALYKKAVGYNISLNKTYKLKRIDYDPDTGKKLREYEELATGTDESFIPPDLKAEAFWLKNRQPMRWQENPKRVSDDCVESLYGIIEMPIADSIDSDDCGAESTGDGDV